MRSIEERCGRWVVEYRDLVSPADLPNLHDATLSSIKIDWKNDRARCVFEVWMNPPQADPAGSRTLVVSLGGLKGAVVPRDEPWGPSVSVNSARLIHTNDAVELRLEMQSGDRVVVRATSADVTTEQ